jgi:D-citramalate synthase
MLQGGDQTPGVKYTPDENLVTAKALLQSGVTRLGSLRIASPTARNIQCNASRRHARMVCWTGTRFGTKYVGWIVPNSGRLLNVFAKSPENHCRVQLRKSQDEHFQDISRLTRCR